MSIASEISRIQQAKSDIKHAIEERGVEVGNITLDHYAEKIIQIPSGGGEPSPYPIIEGNGKYEVRFIDYEGTILKIHRVDEHEDAVPPALPEHENFTFLMWNNNEYQDVLGDVEVGATYTTIDNILYIYHTVTVENGLTKKMPVRAYGSGLGSINWGDGTIEGVSFSSSVKMLEHTYEPGEYVIRMACPVRYHLGNNNRNASLFGNATENPLINSGITKIYTGANFMGLVTQGLVNANNLEEFMPSTAYTFGSTAITGALKLKCLVLAPHGSGSASAITAACFDTCGLEYFPLWDAASFSGFPTRYSRTERITFPRNFVNVNGIGYTGYYSPRLEKIVLPPDLNTIPNMFIYWCHSMHEMIFPEGIETIGTYSVYQSRNVKKVVIPSTVTSIGNFAFTGDSSLADIYVYATEPPVLGGTGCFNSMLGTCKIHVPAESLEAYKAATNWSGQASKMIGDL